MALVKGLLHWKWIDIDCASIGRKGHDVQEWKPAPVPHPRLSTDVPEHLLILPSDLNRTG